MKTYQKFLRLGISLASVGIETRNEAPSYFCTPKDASLIGWAGIDGIHYCFIRGFGEMVFAVSPMNTAPDFVHPPAESFTDFLRLRLEQVHKVNSVRYALRCILNLCSMT